MECPDCKGSGKIIGLFVMRVDGGCELCREFPCFRCNSSGAVPDETVAWMVAGKAMRDDRISRGNTLREEAKNRRVEPSELSGMERGRIEPKPA